MVIGNSSMLFQYFKCDEFPEAAGEDITRGDFPRYLALDYNIDCDSPRYNYYWSFAFFMLGVYPIGIPSMYYVLLTKHKEILQDRHAVEEEERRDYPTIGHLMFLVQSYRPEYWYFEILETVRRLLLASALGMVASDSAAAPTMGVLICMGFLFVFIRFEPFKVRNNNILTIVLAYSTTLFFLAAILIKVDAAGTDSGADAWAFEALLMFTLFSGPTVILLKAAFDDFTAYRAKRRLKEIMAMGDSEEARILQRKERRKSAFSMGDERLLEQLDNEDKLLNKKLEKQLLQQTSKLMDVGKDVGACFKGGISKPAGLFGAVPEESNPGDGAKPGLFGAVAPWHSRPKPPPRAVGQKLGVAEQDDDMEVADHYEGLGASLPPMTPRQRRSTVRNGSYVLSQRLEVRDSILSKWMQGSIVEIKPRVQVDDFHHGYVFNHYRYEQVSPEDMMSPVYPSRGNGGAPSDLKPKTPRQIALFTFPFSFFHFLVFVFSHKPFGSLPPYEWAFAMGGGC